MEIGRYRVWKVRCEMTKVDDFPNGTETILLVDDELAFFQMEKQVLERLGYLVENRTRSDDAPAAFRRDTSAIDLVILGMAMPGLTGTQLAARILAFRPDLPVGGVPHGGVPDCSALGVICPDPLPASRRRVP